MMEAIISHNKSGLIVRLRTHSYFLNLFLTMTLFYLQTNVLFVFAHIACTVNFKVLKI